MLQEVLSSNLLPHIQAVHLEKSICGSTTRRRQWQDTLRCQLLPGRCRLQPAAPSSARPAACGPLTDPMLWPPSATGASLRRCALIQLLLVWIAMAIFISSQGCYKQQSNVFSHIYKRTGKEPRSSLKPTFLRTSVYFCHRCASARAGTVLLPLARAAWQLPGAWTHPSSRALTPGLWQDLIGVTRCCLLHRMPNSICAPAGINVVHLTATCVPVDSVALSLQAQCEVDKGLHFLKHCIHKSNIDRL